MLYRLGLDRMKEKETTAPHTMKSREDFMGASSNWSRARTLRIRPKTVRQALRIKMLQTFVCPPLVVGSEGDLFTVRSLLEIAAKDNFTLELSETGEIKIFPSDSSAYYDIATALLENDLPLRGLKQGGRSKFKALCVGFHQNEDMVSIQKALAALGHRVLQISKPPRCLKPPNAVTPPSALPVFTITLERAENNWEIFNVTKLLGMRVTFRPPARVFPLPKCTNCLMIGHAEYECGRQLCESCECSILRGRNIIAKLAFEWPLAVRKRGVDPKEARKQMRRAIKLATERNNAQQRTRNELQRATNRPQQAAQQPINARNQAQNAVHELINARNQAQNAVHEPQAEIIEPQEANIEVVDVCLHELEEEGEERGRAQRAIMEPSNARANGDTDEDDDEIIEGRVNVMRHSSSNSSSMSSFSGTTTSSTTTGDSAVFDDLSVSERAPRAGELEGFKKIVRKWYLDVRAHEDQRSSSSSERSRMPLLQEMVTYNFTDGEPVEENVPTTSDDPDTYTGVNIMKQRPQTFFAGVPDKNEEQYQENEVLAMLEPAKFAVEARANRSRRDTRRGARVRFVDGDEEGDDLGNGEINYKRLHNKSRRDGGRDRKENDRKSKRSGKGREEPVADENKPEEPKKQAGRGRNLQRKVEKAFRNNFDRIINSLRSRCQPQQPARSDPRAIPERFAFAEPTSYDLPGTFCPTLYNRRYPYRYEELVRKYMSINNTEEIPDETATAWLDMIYYEFESLLNFVDRIGKVESYGVLVEKVEERFFDKFGKNP